MIIYIAGPMRKYPLFNFPLFNRTAAHLRKLGHEVFNPAERDVNEDGFDPAKDHPRPINEYMAIDLPEVCKSDAVVVLPGWEKSQGARVEIMVGMALGKSIVDANFKPIANLSILQEADGLINGPRNASYGPPNQDFKRTADMWTGLLQFKMKDGECIRPQDVALMMILLKASRAQHSNKRDSYVDIAGYAGCGQRCMEEEMI